MGTVADIARTVLALVFVVAGVAKLLDYQGTRSTLTAFGLSPRVAQTAARLLPIAELAVAVALMVRPSAQWGGVGAMVLMLLFIGGISYSLKQGRRPDCNCFGQISSEPVGWRTLVRNAVLALLAVVVVVEGADGSLLGWTGDEGAGNTIAVLAALALVAAMAVGLHFWREKKELQRAVDGLRREIAKFPEGLPVGLRAPHFELADLRGGKVTLEALCARGRPVLLLFLSPGCGPCIRIAPELARWNKALAESVTFAIVSNGSDHETILADLGEAGDVVILVQEGQEVADSYRVLATPTALLVDAEGRIATAPAGRPEEIEALVRLALRRTREVPRPLEWRGGGASRLESA